MIQNEYAEAIFELAVEQSITIQIDNEFKALKELLLDSDVYAFLSSPSIDAGAKKNVINKAFKGFSEIFINFINILIVKNRIDIFNNIYEEYTKLLNKMFKCANVEVYSANELFKKDLDLLIPSIKKLLKKENIIIKNIVDHTLIGGVKIVCDGKQIDLSVKSELLNLKNQL